MKRYKMCLFCPDIAIRLTLPIDDVNLLHAESMSLSIEFRNAF